MKIQSSTETEFEKTIYAACAVIREMAMQACTKGEPDTVHMLVSEERRLARFVQTAKRRLGD